ncbi:hypothetical protein KR044_010190, partial [Drosophila immigrans]
VVDARRAQGNSQRKTPSSSSSGGHVTQPPQQHNNNADLAKLSYSQSNNRPPATQTHSSNTPISNNNNNQNGSPIGWNVPQQQQHQGQAPGYHGAAAPQSPYHTPIQPSQNHNQYAGAPQGSTYYQQPNQLPPGAVYYPSAGHVPSGGYHPAPAAAPTYYQPGAALPPGAVMYPQAPQQSGSSGPGFFTGALAGAATGAVVTHLLSSSGGSSHPVAAAPAAPAAGQDRIIIINNGVPVNASDGTTVINAGGAPAPVAAPVNATQVEGAAMPAQLAPFAPENATMPMSNTTDPAAAPPAPPAGGIICVPVKVNETDPADSTKMVEIEKIACYPAPPPAPVAPGSEPAPLAPMAGSSGMSPPLAPLTTSQPALLPPDQAAVRVSANNAAAGNTLQSMWPLLAALAACVLRFAAAT